MGTAVAAYHARPLTTRPPPPQDLRLTEQGAHLSARLSLALPFGWLPHNSLTRTSEAFVAWGDIPRPLDVFTLAAQTDRQAQAGRQVRTDTQALPPDRARDETAAAALRSDGVLPRHLWGVAAWPHTLGTPALGHCAFSGRAMAALGVSQGPGERPDQQAAASGASR